MNIDAKDGRLVKEHVAAASRAVELGWGRQGGITLDLSSVREIDSAGAAWLATLHRRAAAQGRGLDLVGVQPAVAATLDLLPFVVESPKVPSREGWLEGVGASTAHVWEVLVEYLVLAADVAWFSVAGLFQPRKMRWGQVVFEMASVGSRAFGVVGLIAFLVGGTMALQSAHQLRQFGANIFVVDLIGISITRELGPLMAAIVVAGRSGSAVAAEIATMVITEEVDAVRTMGLNPTRFLIVPKVVAITLTQPVLTVLADVMGILGGLWVAILYLDLGPATFLARLQESLMAKDLITGLVKSVAFAQLIVTIGAFCGMRTRGGADAVGRSTTVSVVASIFAVIVADAVFSLIFYF